MGLDIQRVRWDLIGIERVARHRKCPPHGMHGSFASFSLIYGYSQMCSRVGCGILLGFYVGMASILSPRGVGHWCGLAWADLPVLTYPRGVRVEGADTLAPA